MNIPHTIKRQGRTLIALHIDHPPPDEPHAEDMVCYREENAVSRQHMKRSDWMRLATVDLEADADPKGS